jgi:hypothetical protein
VQQVAQIPIVPERVQPKILLYKPAPPKPKRSGPWKTYKIAFTSGPKLWRTAFVTVALLVLAGLVTTVVAVRPAVPKPGAAPNVAPAVFLPTASAGAGNGFQDSRPALAKPYPETQKAPGAARHRSASDDGLIAKDTVIFYNRKPPTQHEAKLPPPPPSSDVKRYSDAD